MAGNTWIEDVYEEELLPPQALAQETAKELALYSDAELAAEKILDPTGPGALDREEAAAQYTQQLKGRVSLHRPRCRVLASAAGHKGGKAAAACYEVHLRMELDVPALGHRAGWSYSDAWYRAYIYSRGSAQQPRVLDVFPRQLFEGGPDTVHVEVKPGFQLGPVGVKLGGASADLDVGQVCAVTLGFFGPDEAEPYWELRQARHPILGAYDFWMIVEQPPDCGPVEIKCLAEGNLQTRLIPHIPVGPKQRAWADRLVFTLGREFCNG